jgi:hypothetical protein
LSDYYDQLFQKEVSAGRSVHAAADLVAEAYLDGKPRLRGKHKVTSSERDAEFWSSAFLELLPTDAWTSDLMELALARYFAQERVANPKLLAQLATDSPRAVRNAVRYSGLVLRQQSARKPELNLMAGCHHEIAELCKILDIFDMAHRERLAAVECLRDELRALTPFDLLIHASLHAFEHALPTSLLPSPRSNGAYSSDEVAWDAINDILLWGLSMAPEGSLTLDEAEIGRSLSEHLAPLLSPSPVAQAAAGETRARFAELLEAQIELNEFVSRSADAFCYDDCIRFVRNGTTLAIEETDPLARAAWERDGRKLARLHEYWFYRALDAFANWEMATQTIGRPENHEANRLAYIRAMRTRLQLTEVYGVADTVTTEAGGAADLFQALLSLELMSALFLRDFIAEYVRHLESADDWIEALRRLVIGGVAQGLENRLPVTWSDREAKIRRITGWTVCPQSPQGSPRMAAHILDFWTSDWASLAAQLRRSQSGLRPELLERPVLKFGKSLVQLPWLVGRQNNSTAAINNLRRLGARRGEAREETQRIEAHLGKALQARGFKVALNWTPTEDVHGNAGEVDLVAAMEGIVLVLEVKSTFIRKSQRDAWLHANTTLRKAGRQLSRKVAAVRDALVMESELAQALGLRQTGAAPTLIGWIVDTSVERDHERFSGFLKLSLEELLIALRDDRDLLADPDGLFGGAEGQQAQASSESASAGSMYPTGFSAAALVDAITTEAVWAAI